MTGSKQQIDVGTDNALAPASRSVSTFGLD